MKAIKTELDKTNVEHRVVFINEDIDANTVNEAIIAIQRINEYDSKQEEKYKNYIREPIKIFIDSYGGAVYSGLALVNLMTSSKTPVHTYCYSKAMSMGAMIFIAGHKRFIHKNATVMIHQLISGVAGELKYIEETVESLETLNKLLFKIIRKRTNISKKKLRKIKELKKDWFIIGKKNIKLGIATDLIKD